MARNPSQQQRGCQRRPRRRRRRRYRGRFGGASGLRPNGCAPAARNLWGRQAQVLVHCEQRGRDPKGRRREESNRPEGGRQVPLQLPTRSMFPPPLRVRPLARLNRLRGIMRRDGRRARACEYRSGIPRRRRRSRQRLSLAGQGSLTSQGLGQRDRNIGGRPRTPGRTRRRRSAGARIGSSVG